MYCFNPEVVMRVCVLAGVALVLTATAASAADEPAKEWERLQGTWKLVEKAGKADYPWNYINKNGWVVIAKEKATLVIREGGKEMKLAEFAVKIDPSKSPKSLVLTIEFIAPEGPYDWLNKSIFVCAGARYASSIKLWVWRVL
jgi:uncharacterized protein (TIGR03067 family)